MKTFTGFPTRQLSRVICFLAFLAAAGFHIAANAESVDSLAQAKSLFVASFGGGSDSIRIHDGFVSHLSKSKFRLVQSAQDADAVVRGTSQTWIRGYTGIEPHILATDRRPVYAGYISLQVVGAGGQPLWSSLVTLGSNSSIDDLARDAARKLIEASATAVAAPSPHPLSPGALAETTLTAAGATFPAPLYQKWFEDFEQLHPGVRVQYSPVGSQQGDERLAAGELDFAGSDVAPENVIGPDRGASMRRIATVLGGVVPIYNLKGLTQDLRFTPETLAEIYLGHVRRWNDAKIQASNKGVKLPDADIVVLHRSDGSGTSWVWSDYLSKVSPAWSSAVGRGTTLHWPIGIGVAHNEGVAQGVQNTPNSIGYVELTFAIQHQLSYGAVRNRAGEYIHADLDSLADAAKSASADLAVSTITDAPGKNAYPIASFTFLVFPAQTVDPAKRKAITALLQWALTSGQKECSALGYVPLPRAIVERELHTASAFE